MHRLTHLEQSRTSVRTRARGRVSSSAARAGVSARGRWAGGEPPSAAAVASSTIALAARSSRRRFMDIAVEW